MKVRLTDRSVVLDLYELVQDLDEGGVRVLADAVSVRDEVVKCVTQQILDGMTEAGSRAAMYCDTVANPFTGLDWAVREVARRSSEVAKQEIERLERALASKDDELESVRRQLSETRFQSTGRP